VSEFEDALLSRCHSAVRSVFTPGSFEWIDKQYSGDLQKLSDALDETICNYRQEKVKERDVTAVATQYVARHVSWIIEYKRKQKKAE
jgi:hypothetical protein